MWFFYWCWPKPAKYLRMAADYIASWLQQIMNIFISKNTFPAAWKMARVSPLPKVDSQINADQYRLIAILLALSKVYERLVLNQILEFYRTNPHIHRKYDRISQRTFYYYFSAANKGWYNKNNEKRWSHSHYFCWFLQSVWHRWLFRGSKETTCHWIYPLFI